MSIKKINITDLNSQEFYQLPKMFIWDKKYREGLSEGAKLLYMIIRDRFSLSVHTAQKQSESGASVTYQDQDGDIFCVLDNIEISFTLNKAVKTVVNYIEELVELNLISITKIAGGANRIYLNQLESNTTSLAQFLGERDFFKHVHSCKKKGKEIKKTLEECIKAQVQKRENNNSDNSNTDIPSGEQTAPPGDVNVTPLGGDNITPLGVKNLHPNENDLNNPEFNNPDIKENIDKSSRKEMDKPLEENNEWQVTSEDNYELLNNFTDLKEICPDVRAINVVKKTLREAKIEAFYVSDVLNAIGEYPTKARMYERKGEPVKYPPVFFANSLVDRIKLNEVRRKTKNMSKIDNKPVIPTANRSVFEMLNDFSEIVNG